MEMEMLLGKQSRKEPLTEEQITEVVRGYTRGRINDYNMTGFLTNICQYGMSKEETFSLTKAMIESGEKIDLSRIEGIKVDKHSTGGVGDKVTLIVLPLVAACGVPVAKMSGRSLGHTGGTIDKLESIPGFNVYMDKNAFIEQVKEIGIAITAQTGNIAPADKKIYALRDVTNTIESEELIASSIMSKKIASGADKVVLDVKVGEGAFLKTIEEAKKLANLMIEIGENNNKETIALLTNMENPLGYSIGNTLEVKEAIEVLKNNGEPRLKELCVEIASYMVSLGKEISIEEAREEVSEKLENEEGYNKFSEFIKKQGGIIENLPIAKYNMKVTSEKEGYISDIFTEEMGKYVMNLGAGRKDMEDSIDHTVGIVLNKKVGDYVKPGEVLATIHTNKKDITNIKNLFVISKEKPVLKPVVLEVIL